MEPNTQQHDNKTKHLPVLIREVVDLLDLQPGLTVVDGTVGGGGHSRAIWEKIRPNGRLLGIDRDPAMLARAKATLTEPNQTEPNSQIVLRQGSYRQFGKFLDELGWQNADRVLLDLGLSSDQLSDPDRGFGFQTQGDLDLRFDSAQGESAAALLNRLSIEQLAELLQAEGEEPHARAIAQQIADEKRKSRPVQTVPQLVAAVLQALGRSRPGQVKIGDGPHPATRTFQALRIAVNQEFVHLQDVLDQELPSRLVPGGGRAVVITFHSLEDRIVKTAFRKAEIWETLTRKPIVPSPTEVRLNPRSRSAKLRGARRL